MAQRCPGHSRSWQCLWEERCSQLVVRFARRGVVPTLLALAVWLTLSVPGRVNAEPPGGADVVLLLDRSGSMQKNDPDGLAGTGARLFADMLDPGDRVAVITFDSTAHTLLPLSTVGDGSAARNAISGLARPTGQWTDVKAALEAAVGLFDHGDPDRRGAVLLFTDGRPETQASGVPAGYREQLFATVTRLAGRSTPVYTIGLGQADFALLQEIAVGTRAESLAATGPGQVTRLFADVVSRIKERQVAFSFTEDLPPGQSGPERKFQVPPYTRLLTLTAIGNQGQVKLLGQTPAGTALAAVTGLKVNQGANYQVYTIANPTPGTWTVRMKGAGQLEAYGQLESALRLQLLAPAPFSSVPGGKDLPLTVAVDGDPDPMSALDLWAQGGGQPAVRLARSADGRYRANLHPGDGQITVWAVRAGAEVARREFRLHLTAPGAGPGGATPRAAATAGAPPPLRYWLGLALALAGAAGATAALLSLGAWNWRRLRRRHEALAGRLGTLHLGGRGRETAIGPGPTALERSAPAAMAIVEARLVPLAWAPLVGLGLGRRQLRIFIRAAGATRLQINGKPPGDGRLFHGDDVSLGAETYAFSSPQLTRRPVRAATIPRSRVTRTFTH